MTAPSRTTTRRPGSVGHSSLSSSRSKPSASSRAATAAAAWYDEGDSRMKAAKSAMWASRSSAGILPSNTAERPAVESAGGLRESHGRLQTRPHLPDLGAAELGRAGKPLTNHARKPRAAHECDGCAPHAAAEFERLGGVLVGHHDHKGGRLHACRTTDRLRTRRERSERPFAGERL